MKVLSNLFETLRLSRRETACSRPHRRHRIRRQRSALSCETLESKRLLAADVAVQFSDQVLDTTDPVNVAIEGKFGDTAVSGTVVKFETNAPLTDNDFYVELTDNTPLTNANFLSYVNSSAYDGTMIHRSVSNFVLQGGGFSAPTLAADQPGSDPVAIPTTGTIQNEPGNANTRGTIAMAKLGGQPDSASSQFFFNIDNNLFLDSDNGGYTVFGEVLGSGMTVVDTMASALTYDATTYYSNTALSDLPLWNINQDNIVRPNDFLKIENVDVVTESDLFTYQVSSSDPAKLAASFDGNGNLVLTPNSSATGSVDVTVIATSTLDNSTATDTFSVQLNGGDGPVNPGPDQTVIEGAGNTILAKDSDGLAYANDAPIMVGATHLTYNFFESSHNLVMIGAETIDGQNTLLFKNTANGGMSVWFLDSGWVRTGSGSTYYSNTPGDNRFFDSETDFNLDVNEDGVIGIVSAFTFLESQGSTVLKTDSDGLAYANDAPIMVGATHLTYNFFESSHNLVMIGAETIDGQNTLLFKNTANGGMSAWLLDSGWVRTGSGSTYYSNTPGDNRFFDSETDFNLDVNEDGVIGIVSAFTFLESQGSTVLKTDSDGLAYANDAPIMVGATHLTYNFFESSHNLVMIGAETIDGQNTLLFKNTANGGMSAWLLDSSWVRTGSGSTYYSNTPGDNRFFDSETDFNLDVNEDGVIGIVSAFTFLESQGSTVLKTDSDGLAYANDAPIMVGATHLTYNFFAPSHNLVMIGAETIDGQNTLLFKNTVNGGISAWLLDSSWVRTGSGSTYYSNTPGDNRFFDSETDFNLDVNEDGVIGIVSAFTFLESQGSTVLKTDSDGLAYANDAPIMVGATHLTYNFFAPSHNLVMIGAETIDGQNTLLFKNTVNGGISAWLLDSSWVRTGSGSTYYPNTPGDNRFFDSETDFNLDVNEDGVIGNG